MSDDNTEIEVALDPAEAAAEAEAAAAALAGYQARAKAPAMQQPAAVTTEEPAPAPDAADADHVDPAPAAAAQPPAVPDLLGPEDEPDAQPSLESALAQIKELKAAVKSATGSPDAIRKLHGEIGAINRTLQNLGKSPKGMEHPPKPAAPADDELAAALKQIDGAADAFPEVGGPLAAAIKAVANRAASQQVMTPERISELVAKEAEARSIQALAEEHPDFEAVRETPAFQTWIAAQPKEYQDRMWNTWNPAVVATGLTEFKTELKRQQDARAKKQSRLAAAVTPPRSGAAKAGPSTLPDEEGYNVGYNSVRRLNSATQFKR